MKLSKGYEMKGDGAVVVTCGSRANTAALGGGGRTIYGPVKRGNGHCQSV